MIPIPMGANSFVFNCIYVLKDWFGNSVFQNDKMKVSCFHFIFVSVWVLMASVC